MDKFVFLSKKTGKPYCFSVEDNGPDADFCNDTTVRLTDSAFHEQIFTLNTLQAAVDALHFAPEWYNSDLEKPVISDEIKADIKIARMEIKFHPVAYDPPLLIKKGTVDTRDVPKVIVKKMAKNLPPKDSYVVVLFNTKGSDVTRKELEARIGSLVYFGSMYNKRELLAVCTAREEWADLADLELICSSGF